MIAISKNLTTKISPEQLFMISVLLVNGGNYLYNLILGRILGPEQFANAAVLITFLLVLSFIAMTFQLVTAKFSVLFTADLFKSFIAIIYKYALGFGLLFGFLVIIFSKQLQDIFQTDTNMMFVIFGFGVPLYFLMSVNRGVYQGKKEFKSLSITYQSEMLSRLILTLVLILFLNFESSIIVAIGIFISFIFGLFPINIKVFSFKNSFIINKVHNKQIVRFFILTAFYELTQIIINNSDILLVKHYFDSYQAGLYASLALIGRVVYFIAWMFVMLLLPTVIQLKKEGKDTSRVLFKYVGYIVVISSTIILGCILFPETIIRLMFGSSYIEMAPLLWEYAVATSLFAISNIFAYYYLSLDEYIPVVFSGIFGLLQVALIVFFHDNLEQVVHMQILAMSFLLFIQLLFFKYGFKKERSVKCLN